MLTGLGRGIVIRIISWFMSLVERFGSTLEAKAFNAHAGDSFIVDGGVEHQASALEVSEVLDVFTPTREDYRDLIKPLTGKS